MEKATKLKARKNLESKSDKGNNTQPCSFLSRDVSSLLRSTNSLGIILGDNEQDDVINSLNSLREVENFRMSESNKLAEASTYCSDVDILDQKSLNLICSEISKGLGDGGCDPKCLQTPVSQKMLEEVSVINIRKITGFFLDERHFLELQRVC